LNRLAEIVIVAGPNGAGKTSFARQFLPGQFRQYTFVNADEIARSVPKVGLTQIQIDLRAGREMLNRVQSAVALGDDVMIETTLASLNWSRQIPIWRSKGYAVVLYYLRLPSAEAAIERVKRRVATGGHDIPEHVIRRRFIRSGRALEQIYKPIVDEWYVFDSLEEQEPVLVGSGGRNDC
jgi:predicted ABC-type ATPase